MVCNPFRIGRELQILCSHGWRADAFFKPADVPFLHLPGVFVYLLFYPVSLFQSGEIFVLIRIHRIFIQHVQKLLELADFVFGIVRELLFGIGQGGSVFHYVFRIVADPFKIADTPVGT